MSDLWYLVLFSSFCFFQPVFQSSLVISLWYLDVPMLILSPYSPSIVKSILCLFLRDFAEYRKIWRIRLKPYWLVNTDSGVPFDWLID